MWERDAPRLNRKPPGGSQRFQLPTFSAVTDAIGSHPSGVGADLDLDGAGGGVRCGWTSGPASSDCLPGRIEAVILAAELITKGDTGCPGSGRQPG